MNEVVMWGRGRTWRTKQFQKKNRVMKRTDTDSVYVVFCWGAEVVIFKAGWQTMRTMQAFYLQVKY